MSDVTTQELGDDVDRVVDRVVAGEEMTVTRDGRAVARLSPLRRPSLSREELIERFRGLPRIDAALFRRDIDEVFDQSL